MVAEPAKKTAPKQQSFEKNYIYANGKRKTSVARVRLHLNGSGNITINEKTIEEYIPVVERVGAAKTALRLTGHLKTFDISVHVEGGGPNSQAEAIRHGIAKALLEFDPALRITLKRAGLLTRDPRMKERKKYGLHRARRAPQFSKR
ncbi:MAG: 30S ribosomal protein S9 [Patescibacteria group bacterium]